MNNPAIMPYPEFIYDERQDFQYNFWKWRDMADNEAKALFQQQYGHYSKGVAL